MGGSIPALPNPLQRVRNSGFEFGRRLNLHVTSEQHVLAKEGNLKSFVQSLLKEDSAAISFIERSRSRASYSASQINKIASAGPAEEAAPSQLEKMLEEFKKIVDKLQEFGDAPNQGPDPAAVERKALFDRLSELATKDESVKKAFELISGFETRLATGKANLETILNEAAQHENLFGQGFLRAIKSGEVGALKGVADVFRSVSDPEFNPENVDTDQLESLSSQLDAAIATSKGGYLAPQQPSTIEGGLDGLIQLVKRLKKTLKGKLDNLDSPEVKKSIDDEIQKTNAALKSALQSVNFREFSKIISDYYEVAKSPKSDLRVIGDLLDQKKYFIGARVPELFRKGQFSKIEEILHTFGALSNLQVDPNAVDLDSLDKVINSLKDAKKLIKGERAKPKSDSIIEQANVTRTVLDQLRKSVTETTAKLVLGLGDDPSAALGAHSGLNSRNAAFLLVIGNE